MVLDRRLHSKVRPGYRCQPEFDLVLIFMGNVTSKSSQGYIGAVVKSIPAGPGMKDVELVIVNSGGSPLPPELWMGTREKGVYREQTSLNVFPIQSL